MRRRRRRKNNKNEKEEEGKQLKCGGGGGGCGKTIEMWRWWYIASLFTKQCLKKVECRVDVGSMWGQRFERNLLK